MPLEIHEACKNRLIEVLTGVLSKLRVKDGSYLTNDSLEELLACDHVLPRAVRELAETMISDQPFSMFAYCRLSREIWDKRESKEVKCRLEELPGFADLASLARTLVEEFASLPWTYVFFCPLSLGGHGEASEEPEEYMLGPGVALVRPGAEFSEKYPLKKDEIETLISAFSGLPERYPRSWEPNSYYLRLELLGFVGRDFPTFPVERARILVRAFCGIALATGVVSFTQEGIPSAPKPAPLYTFRLSQDGREPVPAHMLAREYAEVVEGLEWSAFSRGQGKHWVPFMQYFASQIAVGLTREPLSRASQWYFDSHCGENELLQFIEATVALEILLGDKAASDLVGVTELLASRCAYLVATTHDERERIQRDFRDAYNTRSKIVHRGQNRLGADERVQLRKLQFLCGRVIRKELELAAGIVPKSNSS